MVGLPWLPGWSSVAITVLIRGREVWDRAGWALLLLMFVVVVLLR